MREVDEGRLARQLASGDRSAADRLVECTYRRIFGYLSRLCGGDVERAADLTQETYRKAWAALDGFDGRSKLSTWLYSIAYRTFLNHRRRPFRLVGVDELEAVSTQPLPDELVGRASQDHALRRAVLELPESLRFTVTAHYWGELPVKEIARQEEVTPVAIRKRLKKAFALLAGALAKEAS
ncbi:MAG: sigma-70 family RNA polymerase sigma factor [Acidobacteriota bacterium]